MAMYSEGSGSLKMKDMRLKLRSEVLERLQSNLNDVISPNKSISFDELITAIEPIVAGRFMTVPEVLKMVNKNIYPEKLRVRASLTSEYGGFAKDVPLVDSLELIDLTDEKTVAKLVLRGRNLWLETPREKVLLKKYRSTGTDNFKALSALLTAGTALSVDELGLSGTTELKDLPKNMGFSGSLRDIFIEYDAKDRTLKLLKSAEISMDQLSLIKKSSVSAEILESVRVS